MATDNNNLRVNTGNTESGRRPYTLDRVVRLLISVAFVVGAIWLIDKLHGVLLPFLVAWVIAYILEPVVQFNKRIFKLKKRFGAVLLALLEATIVLTALFIIFVPPIITEIHDMSEIIRHYLDSSTGIPLLSAGVNEFLRQHIDFCLLYTSPSPRD